jgi:hypothetical protein
LTLTLYRSFDNFQLQIELFREVMAMPNVVGIIIAVVIIIIGFVLLVVWWAMFIGILKGVIPVFLILIGAGALVYFISEIKSKLEIEKPSSDEKTETK